MKLLTPFLIILSLAISLPLTAQTPSSQFLFTSERLVTPDDLMKKDLITLKIMRNEIFARHGHTFKGEDLKKYFSEQAWYRPTVADATPLLSDLEKTNADLIKKWETKITQTSDFSSFYSLFKKNVSAEDADKLSELMSQKGYFESIEKFKEIFMRDRAEIQIAIEKSSPKGDDMIRSIRYGEFYNGVQYKWVEFHKEGCCWFIFAFGKAG